MRISICIMLVVIYISCYTPNACGMFSSFIRRERWISVLCNLPLSVSDLTQLCPGVTSPVSSPHRVKLNASCEKQSFLKVPLLSMPAIIKAKAKPHWNFLRSLAMSLSPSQSRSTKEAFDMGLLTNGAKVNRKTRNYGFDFFQHPTNTFKRANVKELFLPFPLVNVNHLQWLGP